MTSPYLSQQPLRPYSRPLQPPSLSSSSNSSHPLPPPPSPSPWDPQISITTPPGLNTSNEIDFGGMIVAGILGFTSTGMVMPFEVGKCLLQVRWEPKEGVRKEVEKMLGGGEEIDKEEKEEKEEESKKKKDKEEQEEEESYFDYQDQQSSHRKHLHSSVVQSSSPPPPPSAAPKRKKEKSSSKKKKEWHIIDDSKGEKIVGTWDMIKVVGKTEGWRGLWKGQLTTFIADSVSSSVQPLLLTILTTIIPSPSLSSTSFQPSPPISSVILPLTSHVITSFFLSPLDLIRTRLIVQSQRKGFVQYNGLVNAVTNLIDEINPPSSEESEKSILSLWFHPTILVPTLLDITLRPLIHLSIPLLLDRLSLPSSSFSSHLLTFVLSSSSLLLTLPIETIRRRLQLSSLSPGGTKPAIEHPAVGIRPVAYQGGMIGVVLRMWKEENEGFRKFWRGWKMGVAANAVVLGLNLLAGEGEGWAEI